MSYCLLKRSKPLYKFIKLKDDKYIRKLKINKADFRYYQKIKERIVIVEITSQKTIHIKVSLVYFLLNMQQLFKYF